jgi:hypothetical protein
VPFIKVPFIKVDISGGLLYDKVNQIFGDGIVKNGSCSKFYTPSACFTIIPLLFIVI